MDKLCLCIGFLVDDVSHIVCYCLNSYYFRPVTDDMTKSFLRDQQAVSVMLMV